MANSVKLKLSKQEITFRPQDARDFNRQDNSHHSDLTVTVINTTEKFASFQLELFAEGLEKNSDMEWYSTEPHICAKKPPGDRTEFQITILKSPFPAYDIKIPIKIKILSPEIEHISSEATVILKILPPDKSLWVDFPIRNFTGYPGDHIKVPALIYNWSLETKKISLQITANSSKTKGNIEADKWFPQGNIKSLDLRPGNSEEISFLLVPPKNKLTLRGEYSLALEVHDDEGNYNSTYGTIQILSFGAVVFDCPQDIQIAKRLPSSDGRRSEYQGTFELFFENKSNLSQTITIDTQIGRHAHFIEMKPEILKLNTAHIGQVKLSVVTSKPWLRTQKIPIDIYPNLVGKLSGEATDKITVNPNHRKLELKIKPIVPIWLFILGFLSLLSIPYLFWLYSPKSRHTAPISSISTNPDAIFSGSSDQRLIYWQINRNQKFWINDINRPKFQRIISQNETDKTTNKPIRVVSHLPGDDSNKIALGLEDGNIELWNTSDSSRPEKFSTGKTGSDRIFDLAFTKDTRFLFSGHGSGRINQWLLQQNPSRSVTSYLYIGTAISSIAISEKENSEDFLIAGGRFNRLSIWNYKGNKGYNLSYEYDKEKLSLADFYFNPITSQNSYITSLAVVDNDRSSILVTADSQGILTTWNLDNIRRCSNSVVQGVNLWKKRARNEEGLRYFSLKANEAILNQNICGKLIVDQWQGTQSAKSVRSIAISGNGCYLATVGDDGRVMLWPLTTSNERSPKFESGLPIKVFKNTKLNSIDINHEFEGNKDIIFISSDAPNNQVRLYRRELKNNGCKQDT